MTDDIIKVLGVDPGIHGALASYDGTTMWCCDVPIITYKPAKSSKKMKSDINLPELVELVEFQLGGCNHCYFEKVGAMPGQGVTSMFNFGDANGQLRGVVAAFSIPITYISPVKWKAELGLNSDGEKSRIRALQLFPNNAKDFKLKKDHNKAEAALLAYYGYKMLKFGKVR